MAKYFLEYKISDNGRYFFHQKYLNALKLFILTEPLEKQNEVSELLIDLIIKLIKEMENISKIRTKKDILARLEKIEKNLA